MTALAAVTFVVRDYDEAIGWFARCLDFDLIEDTPLTDGKRWVLVGARGGGSRLLLARAEGEEQALAIGKAAGGRVAFFLHTDDFSRDHAAMLAQGVKFREAPRQESYGTVAVFEDLYGNGWDLIEPRAPDPKVNALSG
jgi:catechol 2,3-dioxygenase-like lactoylglutathione lyase family enzyme